MQKYIDPLSDFGFKKIFGSEQSKDLLMSFLNDLLILEAPIVDLNFENIERQGEIKEDRKSLYDIRCIDQNGSPIIVELQKADQDFFRDRMFYYTSTVVSDLGIKGDWDYSLPKIYAIGIANFNIFRHDLNYLHYGRILDIQTHQPIYDKYDMVFIEIKKFYKKSNELTSHLDKWLYFIKHLTKDQSIYDLFKNDPTITKGLEIAEVAKLDRNEYQSYLAYVNERNNQFAELETAKRQGIQQGIQQGEIQAKLETAKNFLSMGLSIEQVCQGTGLTLEQLKEHLII